MVRTRDRGLLFSPAEEEAELLWTIYPMQTVMSGQTDTPRRREISRDGRLLMVSEAQDGNYRIERLISTDPADYLDPQWQPGRIIPSDGTI